MEADPRNVAQVLGLAAVAHEAAPRRRGRAPRLGGGRLRLRRDDPQGARILASHRSPSARLLAALSRVAWRPAAEAEQAAEAARAAGRNASSRSASAEQQRRPPGGGRPARCGGPAAEGRLQLRRRRRRPEPAPRSGAGDRRSRNGSRGARGSARSTAVAAARRTARAWRPPAARAIARTRSAPKFGAVDRVAPQQKRRAARQASRGGGAGAAGGSATASCVEPDAVVTAALMLAVICSTETRAPTAAAQIRSSAFSFCRAPSARPRTCLAADCGGRRGRRKRRRLPAPPRSRRPRRARGGVRSRRWPCSVQIDSGPQSACASSGSHAATSPPSPPSAARAGRAHRDGARARRASGSAPPRRATARLKPPVPSWATPPSKPRGGGGRRRAPPKARQRPWWPRGTRRAPAPTRRSQEHACPNSFNQGRALRSGLAMHRQAASGAPPRRAGSAPARRSPRRCTRRRGGRARDLGDEVRGVPRCSSS